MLNSNVPDKREVIVKKSIYTTSCRKCERLTPAGAGAGGVQSARRRHRTCRQRRQQPRTRKPRTRRRRRHVAQRVGRRRVGVTHLLFVFVALSLTVRGPNGYEPQDEVQ